MCQAADRGRRREADQAGDERPLAAEQVPELAAEQQQAPEGEGVGGDDPLPAVGREVQFPLRGRQGYVDDRRVEDHHQLGGAQ